MAKIDYNAISFKNKDIDKFSTAFSEKKDPIKKVNIQAASESTNVNTPASKAIVTKKTPLADKEKTWLEKYQDRYGKPTGRQSAG